MIELHSLDDIITDPDDPRLRPTNTFIPEHKWPTLPEPPPKKKRPGRVPTATSKKAIANRERMRARRAAAKGAQ